MKEVFQIVLLSLKYTSCDYKKEGKLSSYDKYKGISMIRRWKNENRELFEFYPKISGLKNNTCQTKQPYRTFHI